MPPIQLALALAATALGADVTLQPGDDINGLTSSLIAGDTVTFTPGVYEMDGSVSWSGFGAEGSPILFTAASPGEVTIRNNGGGYVANIVESEWIVVRGIVFEGGGDLEANEPSGMRINNSTNVTVEDCVIRNVWGSVLRIDGNNSQLTITRTEMGPSEDGSGVYAGVGNGNSWLSDSVFSNNWIHDVAGTGMQFFLGTNGVRIEDNVIHTVGSDGINLPDVAGGTQNEVIGNAIWQAEDDGLSLIGPALVQSNIIFETRGDGIVTGSSDGSLFNVQISHNTVVRADGWAADLNGWYDADTMVFANNALSNPTGRGLDYFDEVSNQDEDKPPAPDTTNFLSNNVVTGFVQGFDRLVRPTWVIEGGGVRDYEDIDNFDFYPSVGSELINQGTPDGNAYIPLNDFNGNPRNGAAPDAGAYEWDASNNPGWLIQEGFKALDGSGSGRGSDTLSRGCCQPDNTAAQTGQALLFGPLLLVGALWRRRES